MQAQEALGLNNYTVDQSQFPGQLHATLSGQANFALGLTILMWN